MAIKDTADVQQCAKKTKKMFPKQIMHMGCKPGKVPRSTLNKWPLSLILGGAEVKVHLHEPRENLSHEKRLPPKLTCLFILDGFFLHEKRLPPKLDGFFFMNFGSVLLPNDIIIFTRSYIQETTSSYEIIFPYTCNMIIHMQVVRTT